MPKKERIWELDALRGLCILFMVGIHLILDLKGFDYYGSWLFNFLRTWGSVLFLLISGICVTLGSHSVRRGIIVFAAGLLCTVVTVGMFLLHFADGSVIILFGVLHCLGLCMILWPAFRKLPVWALGLCAAMLLGLGYWFQTFYVSVPGLFPLGLTTETFRSADYFPMLPHLGWFLSGAILGKIVYREKETRFPRVNAQTAPIRALSWCGRQSLFIYLLHQPILYGITSLISILSK